MPTVKQLLKQIALLEEENSVLKSKQGFFTLFKETSSTTDNLLSKKVPYFKEIVKENVDKTGEPVTTLIKGDNLAALLPLNFEYERKVDVIYIDPPYNTGKNVYTYKDDFSVRVKDSHSSWLSFMQFRLELARPLLRDTGVIMVSVGLKEQARLKMLMDSVFGEDNFISMLTFEAMLKNNAKYVSNGNEYMLIYARDIEKLKIVSPVWRSQKPSAKFLINKVNEIWEKNNHDVEKTILEIRTLYKEPELENIFTNEPGLKMYNQIDSNGRLYRSGDLSSPNNNGGRFDVINPLINKKVAIPTRGWVHSEETFKQMINEGLIVWNGTKIPSFKRFLDASLNIVLSDVVKADRNLPSRTLQKMIGRNKFTFPKNHSILSEWFDYVIPKFRLSENEPVIVMDFFAGSGTTAHAVALLNDKDSGNRETILITSDENNIPSKVTVPRLKALFMGEWFAGKMLPSRGQLRVLETRFYSGRNEPKTPWSIVSFSPSYQAFCREKISYFRDKKYL